MLTITRSINGCILNCNNLITNIVCFQYIKNSNHSSCTSVVLHTTLGFLKHLLSQPRPMTADSPPRLLSSLSWAFCGSPPARLGPCQGEFCWPRHSPWLLTHLWLWTAGCWPAPSSWISWTQACRLLQALAGPFLGFPAMQAETMCCSMWLIGKTLLQVCSGHPLPVNLNHKLWLLI